VKRIPLILMAVVLASVLIVTACATPAPTPTPSTPAPSAPAPTTPTPAKEIVIKFGYDTPPTTNLGVPVEFFAKEINAKLAGKVKVQTYPAGTLITMGTSMQGVRTGVADMYVISYAANLDNFPIMSVTSLPGLSFFPDTVKDMAAEVAAHKALVAKYKSVQEELKGLKLIWSNTYSTAVLMGKKSIRVPADIAGVKVGCDGLRQEVTTSLGGVPVFTIPPQMYQQLQTGVCDSVLVAWGAAMDWQLQEQCKNVLDFSFGGSQMPIIMNENSWNKLSAEYQKVFMEVAAQAEKVNQEEVYRVIPIARKKWADVGVTITKPTADEQKMWYDKYAIVWNTFKTKNKAAPDIESIFNDWKKAAETPR
jgi:TRAP-type C4-dicarboxylate transport system substrate-binding protein